MKLTEEEVAAMPAKATRDAEVIDIYREHDFVEAYALHTKLRIEKTGYKCAVGADDANWDSHGELQRDFLISQGMKPEHRLLEIGCGTGRLARKVVPYLEAGNYRGVDISSAAISNAASLAVSEGWSSNRPVFSVGEVPWGLEVEYAWAFSVFIHLPQDLVESVMRDVAGAMHVGSKFFWAYVPEPVTYRSGVKQFRHTLDDYHSAARSAGLTFEDVPDWIKVAGYEQGRWSGSQRVAVSRLA